MCKGNIENQEKKYTVFNETNNKLHMLNRYIIACILINNKIRKYKNKSKVKYLTWLQRLL